MRYAIVFLFAPALACAEGGSCPDGMSALPAGSFTSAYKDKKAVTVGAFCLDNNEVTVQQYADCVKSGKCKAASKGEDCNVGKSSRKDHPINCVDWKQANAYCAAQGKRLPTLGEWEWAARGGPAGNPFPWGKDKPKKQVCWFDMKARAASEDAPSSTCPVTEPKGDVTPQGVHGLGGNVSEWTSTGDSARFLAGGSAWSSRDPNEVSVSTRIDYPPDEHNKDFGFRCAK